MAEYCIFQQNFDCFLYLNKPLNLNKDFEFNKKKLIEHGAQIPSKFSIIFSEEECVDHGYLNGLIYIIKFLRDPENYYYDLNLRQFYENDYLQLLIFVGINDVDTNMFIYGKSKILNHFGSNLSTLKYSSLLTLSIKYINYEAAQFLIEKGGLDKSYNSIHVREAVYTGNLKMVKLTVENGGVFNTEVIVSSAITHCNLPILNYFVEKNIKFSDGFKLIQSCITGNLKLVKILINNGNYQIADLQKSLYVSCQHCHYNIAKFLIKKGFKLDMNNVYRIMGDPKISKLIKKNFKID